MFYIEIDIKEFPKTCDDCPLFVESYDEDAMWGSGYSSSCLFGCDHIGCCIERPKDCVLKYRETDT